MNSYLQTARKWVEKTAVLFWASAVTLVGILPLSNFVGHSHWEYIIWWPPVTAEEIYRTWLYVDIFGNIGLFLPLGVALARRGLFGRKCPLVATISFALLLSASIEFYQVFCHNRHSSLLDLFNNVLGATLGHIIARRLPVLPFIGPLAPPPYSHPTGS